MDVETVGNDGWSCSLSGQAVSKNAYERIDFPVLWMYCQETDYLKCTFLMFSFVGSTYLNTPF